MLEQVGLRPAGIIHDLAVHERILDSTLFGKGVFSLDAIAKRYGYEKYDGVKAWCEKNGGVTKEKPPGKDKTVKLYHFDRAPKSVIVPYAEQDGRATFDVGQKQLDRLAAADLEYEKIPSLKALVDNERELTRTVYEMERVGVKVDLKFCRDAAAFEMGRHANLKAEFEKMTGVKYVSSAKCFTPLFAGVALKKTPGGTACFDSEALQHYKHPLTPIILGIRDAKSKSDYYNGFLYHATKDGTIHASFNQYQARTGRFSSSEPNLQNLTKNEDEELDEQFVVRRAFVPRDGFFFAMFDYDQMEYRLMMDYSGAQGLIDKVLGGLDVHQATADLAGITRRQAKTANFLTIYGGGDAVLAARLGYDLAEAQRIRAAIKAAAPENAAFMSACYYTDEERGFVRTWLGRRMYTPPPVRGRTMHYTAPNRVIQGGCADIMKVAMNRIAAHLRGFKSRMVLSIHDEAVLECHESEAWILPEIKRIMEGVYKWKRIPLTCGADHSFKSLADKVAGYPGGVSVEAVS